MHSTGFSRSWDVALGSIVFFFYGFPCCAVERLVWTGQALQGRAGRGNRHHGRPRKWQVGMALVPRRNLAQHCIGRDWNSLSTSVNMVGYGRQLNAFVISSVINAGGLLAEHIGESMHCVGVAVLVVVLLLLVLVVNGSRSCSSSC